jgi:hypothetical protein
VPAWLTHRRWIAVTRLRNCTSLLDPSHAPGRLRLESEVDGSGVKGTVLRPSPQLGLTPIVQDCVKGALAWSGPVLALAHGTLRPTLRLPERIAEFAPGVCISPHAGSSCPRPNAPAPAPTAESRRLFAVLSRTSLFLDVFPPALARLAQSLRSTLLEPTMRALPRNQVSSSRLRTFPSSSS